MLTTQETAYLAGILDGEGALFMEKVTRDRIRPSYFPRISVSQKDKRLCLWLQKRLGGSIHDNRTSGTFQWHCPVSGIKKMLECCLPYFVMKKQQALHIIAMRDSIERYKGHRYGTGKIRPVPDAEYAYRTRLYELSKEYDPSAIFLPSAGATTEQSDSSQEEMRQSGLHTNEKVESTGEKPVPTQSVA